MIDIGVKLQTIRHHVHEIRSGIAFEEFTQINRYISDAQQSYILIVSLERHWNFHLKIICKISLGSICARFCNTYNVIIQRSVRFNKCVNREPFFGSIQLLNRTIRKGDNFCIMRTPNSIEHQFLLEKI